MLLRRHHQVAKAAPADASGETLEAPAGNGSRDAWQDYAIARGLEPGTVADMTRDEIRAAIANLDADASGEQPPADPVDPDADPEDPAATEPTE